MGPAEQVDDEGREVEELIQRILALSRLQGELAIAEMNAWLWERWPTEDLNDWNAQKRIQVRMGVWTQWMKMTNGKGRW